MSEPIRAAQFIDSIGVNTHVIYTDGKYANVANVIADIRYLGLTYVRDAAIGSSNQGQASFGMLADAGVKFDMVVQGNRDPKAAVSTIAAWSAAHPGSLIAIEGPNEINNWPVSYAGLTGKDAGVAYQQDLNSAIRANGSLHGVASYGLTGTDAATSSDYANFHVYPKNGSQPWRPMVYGRQTQTSAMAGKPVVLTEAGYYTAPQSSNWGGVDQRAQAKMTLNTLMDATTLGVSRTYLYQLLDAYPDPSGINIDKNLGLFDLANKPKLAATAVHNLTALLADNAPDGFTFTTNPVNFTLSNMPATGNSLQFEKANGKHDIVVWAEPDIWNEANHTAITAPGFSVTLQSNADHYAVAIYDPLISSTKPVKTYADTTSSMFYVSDHPIIVELTAIAPATVASPALASNTI